MNLDNYDFAIKKVKDFILTPQKILSASERCSRS